MSLLHAHLRGDGDTASVAAETGLLDDVLGGAHVTLAVAGLGLARAVAEGGEADLRNARTRGAAQCEFVALSKGERARGCAGERTSAACAQRRADGAPRTVKLYVPEPTWKTMASMSSVALNTPLSPLMKVPLRGVRSISREISGFYALPHGDAALRDGDVGHACLRDTHLGRGTHRDGRVERIACRGENV